jgi:poly(beta-D-mannuronate) lyase
VIGVTNVVRFSIVATILGVLSAVAPAASAASARPVPTITKLTVSKSAAYVGDRVVFAVGLRNSGSSASAAVPLEIRLSKSRGSRGSMIVYRGTLKSVPAKASRTYGYAAPIWSNVPSGDYHVLVCRTIYRKRFCQDEGELRVARRPAKLALSPGSTVNFGTVTEGATSTSRRFVLRNGGQKPTGDIDLDIRGDDDEDFRITSTNCGRSLGSGGACTVDVAFRPTGDGRLEAELEADPDEGGAVATNLVGVGRENADAVEDDEDEVTGDDSPGVECKTSANSTGAAPGSVLNLTNWKLTLPVDGCDDNEWADEVTQPELATFRDARYFTVNSARGVVFRARVDGARTSANTKYPRSELREMTNRGEERASWSNESSSDGVHRMTMEAAITAAPLNKPHVVAAQIHDDDDDVVMVRLYGKQLVVDAADSSVRLLLDSDYQLGQRFTVSITASKGAITVVYNGNRTVTHRHSGSDMYFKAGCYTLSNTSYDRADRFGEVVIYKLGVSHA